MAATLGGTPTGTSASIVSSISIAHTASGTNRAAWAGVGGSGGTPRSVDTATYGGNSMTPAYATLFGGSFHAERAFYIAGDASVAASSQTVQANYSGSTDEATIEVISIQGVDSATPIGTPATTTTNGATPSVTVGSVGAGDFVVDHVYAGDGLADSNPGANQTTGTERLINQNYSGSSYQNGSDGGVMSYALSGTPAFGTCLGAVNFKELSVSAPSAPQCGRTIYVMP